MAAIDQFQKPTGIRFWGSYGIHMRPYLLFISGSAGLCGMAIGYQNGLLQLKTIVAFLAFFLAYGFGQALTDCFQVDTDRISAPYRPLSRGIVSIKSIAIVSMLGLIACSFVFIYYNLWNIILTGLSIIGLASYSYFKKNYWYIGPFYNSWIVALLPIMGYLISSEEPYNITSATLIISVGLNFLAYANFVLIGYLKDISADRTTSYKTFPVLFGWDKTVWVGDLFVLGSILLSYQLITLYSISWIVWLIASILAISGQLYGHFTTDKTESNATFPITMTVRSYILWNLCIVLAYYPEVTYFVFGFYLLFELLLFLRPMREQV